MSNGQAKGMVMHTALAVSTGGLVLGILDQKIHSRPSNSEEIKNLEKRKHNTAIRIEDKKSVRWLEAFKKTNNLIDSTQTEVVTVCDREADIYDFFECAHNLNSAVLVRAYQNRSINKQSRFSNDKQRLWEVVKGFPCQGIIKVEIPARDNKPKRTACLEVRFGKFMMNPDKSSIRHKTEELPNLPLYAVYVVEKDSSSKESPLEWMLLTNLPVNSFDEAVEKVSWYCLRWKIERYYIKF